MADNKKEIVIRTKLDTTDSISQIEKLKRGLKDGLNGDDLSKRFEKLNKTIDSGVVGVKDMKNAIREYQDIAMRAGEANPISEEALHRAAKLQDRLEDTRKKINVLSRDGKILNASISIGQSVVNSYTAFTGITQLLGKSNKDLLQTMAKLQIIMNTMQATEQILNQLRRGGVIHTYALAAAKKVLSFSTGAATTSLNAFRVALIGTGIGAIIVAIGTLIAKFDDLVKWIKKVVGAFNEEAEAAINAGEAALNNAAFATDRIEKEYKRRLEILKASGKDTLEFEKRYSEAKIKLIEKEMEVLITRTRIEILNGKLTTEQIRERTKQIYEMIDKLKDARHQVKLIDIEIEKSLNKVSQNVDKKPFSRGIEMDYMEKIRLQAETYEQIINKVEMSQRRLNDNVLFSIKQIGDLRREYDFLIKKFNISTSELEKFGEDVGKSFRIIENSTNSVINSFESIFYNLSQLSARGSAQQKRFALASLMVNQAQAIGNAVLAASRSAAELAYDPTGVARIAIYASTFMSIASSVISTILQAKRILGESGGVPSVDTNKGGGGNVNIGNQQERLEKNVGYVNPAIQKVIVVESDITRMQQEMEKSNKLSVI